ncbi:WD repeat and HMG-box DNA-binding protein 1 [Gryllus bimaculatus]|nr:WD repeat and HMG-box DNA-binding protein 1 [Gryllus bimaculatus]
MSVSRRPMRYCHTEGHTDVCFSDDGKYIVTSGNDGDIRVWCGLEDDDPNSQCVGETAFAVAFKGETLFVATDNNKVQAYTFPQLEKDGIICNFTAPVTQIVISNNGKKVICGSRYEDKHHPAVMEQLEYGH